MTLRRALAAFGIAGLVACVGTVGGTGGGTGGGGGSGAVGGGTGGSGGSGGGAGGASGGGAGGVGGSSGGSGGSSGGGVGGSSGGSGGSSGGGGGSSGGSGGSSGGGSGGGGGSGDGGMRYTTNFPATENPVSEGGAWHNNGLDWTPVATTPGRAFSTQTRNEYDDSYAYLSGFDPDQSGEGVIHLAAGYNPGGASHEVEVILRASDTAHTIRWYECNLAWNGGYAQIVLLDGALGQFTDVTQIHNPIAPKDGDVFKCTISGNVITSYLNGVMMSRSVNSAIATGQPGMAFFIRPGATATSYCFSSFTATSP
jgi:hypothetical protein